MLKVVSCSSSSYKGPVGQGLDQHYGHCEAPTIWVLLSLNARPIPCQSRESLWVLRLFTSGQPLESDQRTVTSLLNLPSLQLKHQSALHSLLPLKSHLFSPGLCMSLPLSTAWPQHHICSSLYHDQPRHHFCLSHQYEHPTLENTNPSPTSDVKREA